MRFFILALLPFSVVSAPNSTQMVITLANLLSTGDKFQMSDLEYYQNMSTTFWGFIPVPFKYILEDWTPTEKALMVKTVNDVESGKIVISNDYIKILDYICKASSTMCARINKGMDWVTNVETTDEVKQKIHERLNEGIAAAAGDSKTRANRVAKFIADTYDKWTNEPTSFKDQVEKTSPEARKLLDSSFAGRFAKAARMFANSGYTADIYKLSAVADIPPK